MMDKSRSLTVPSKLENIALLTEFVTAAAKEAGLDDTAIYHVQLAVDEAFANIVQHACKDDACAEVECACDCEDDSLTITFRDHGNRFDPEDVPNPDLDTSLEDRQVGGLGLYFMRQVMDEVRFEFDESGNVLTMIKYKEPPP